MSREGLDVMETQTLPIGRILRVRIAAAVTPPAGSAVTGCGQPRRRSTRGEESTGTWLRARYDVQTGRHKRAGRRTGGRQATPP